jgi:hypothetical protein
MANHVSPHGGPYSSKDPFLYTELDALIDALIKSPNFDEGSAHAPTADIELSGSMGGGFVFADDFPFSGEIDAAGDVTVNASSAALWTFTADVTVQTLGPVEFYGVTTLKSGGTFVTAAGSTTTFGAQVYFDGLVDFRSGSDVEIKSGATWDFDAGATVGLAATMTVTGQITVSGTGNISVASSGQILGASGSILTWLGTANLQNEVNFTSGSDVEVKSGAAWDFESGSTLGLAGTTSITGATTFASGTYPLLSSRAWTERTTVIAVTSYGVIGGDVGPADANMWTRRDAGTSVPTYITDTQQAAGAESLIEFTNLPHGQTITTVSLETNGTNANTPDFYPTYRLVRWQAGDTAFANMSNITTDEHATTLDWSAANQITEITVTALGTIDRAYRYGVRVIHPYHTATGTGLRVYDIWAEGTQASLQR